MGYSFIITVMFLLSQKHSATDLHVCTILLMSESEEQKTFSTETCSQYDMVIFDRNFNFENKYVATI